MRKNSEIKAFPTFRADSAPKKSLNLTGARRSSRFIIHTSIFWKGHKNEKDNFDNLVGGSNF